jgi:hypothetical protein
MHTKRIFQLLTLAAVVALAIVSCTPAPVTIDERVASFIDALNSAYRSGIQDNFHPTLTQDVVSGAILTYVWTTTFPDVNGGTAYSQTAAIDETNTSAVIVTIDGPTAFGGPRNLKLVMALEGVDDWRIQELWMNSAVSLTDWAAVIQ